MVFTRKGTHQGSKHLQLGFNNQDGVLLQSFTVPAFEKQYHVGIVSDGCTGLPGFSKTEVGAGLLPVFAFGRCQEIVCSGLPLSEIPRALFQACTEFLRDLAQKVMPPNILWDYPEELRAVFEQRKTDRMGWNSTTRFRIDYLSATLLGFITDEEQVVTFTAGDGIVLVNDDLTVIDQNDTPDYPAHSINRPGKGFEVNVYEWSDVQRLAICSDGLQHLMQEAEFVDQMFGFMPDSMLGLQILLNNTYRDRDELMEDDCTAVTLENHDAQEEED